uniref:Uncharacterized protein n=1 Tax=Panagrolaimus sp. JU765 TaxID=591449 RepID=A0AC34RD02_9BILA
MTHFVVVLLFTIALVFSANVSHQVQSNFRVALEQGKIDVNDALRDYPGSWTDLADPLFQAALKKFGIKFANKNEEHATMEIFTENLIKANELTKSHKTAFFGINQFSFISREEFENTYLMRPMHTRELHGKEPVSYGPSTRENSSISNDLRAIGAISPVRNQGMCGSCWAVSLASGYYNRAFSFAMDNGIVEESADPYQGQTQICKNATTPTVQVKDYIRLNYSDTTSIMNAVDDGFSVAVSVNATIDFQSYVSGILMQDDCASAPGHNHAIVIVGYGREGDIDYWIIRNSWGEVWGESGYVRIRRNINYCQIEANSFFPIV